MHSQPVQKGSSSWNKLDNKPDWFLYIFKAVDCDATTLWTERCRATHGIFHATKKSTIHLQWMLQGYTVLDALTLQESFLVFVQMIFAIDIDIYHV